MVSRRLREICVALVMACMAGPVAAIELSASERAGKQIFLEGRSATGSHIGARVGSADTPMPATVVPCANCHGTDARGRREGGVRPSDITWRRLTAPYGQHLESGREHPAYDPASFARAVSAGVDPGGNRLSPAMPRFTLSARDIEDLMAYLKRVEEDHDPGLLEDVLRLGTLQPARGPLAPLGRTITAVLRGAVASINAEGGIHGRRLELVVAESAGDARQDEAALRGLIDDGEVFALLAPLAPALDGRLGDLADAAHIPLVGPLAQVTSSDGGFEFDPMPGLGEQLGALAEYAATSLALDDPPAAIVHPDDPRSGALAAGLGKRLARRGWSQVRAVAYRPGRFDPAALAEAVTGQGAKVVFFAGRDAEFAALAGEAPVRAAKPWLLAAATQVGPAALQLEPALAEQVLIAYPTLPQDWSPQGAAALQAARRRGGAGEEHLAFQVDAFAAAMVLVEGLKRSGRDASREKLVNALENLRGYRTGLSPVIGFGPGRRVGAPGAHIVAVDPGKKAFRPTGHYVRLDLGSE